MIILGSDLLNEQNLLGGDITKCTAQKYILFDWVYDMTYDFDAFEIGDIEFTESCFCAVHEMFDLITPDYTKDIRRIIISVLNFDHYFSSSTIINKNIDGKLTWFLVDDFDQEIEITREFILETFYDISNVNAFIYSSSIIDIVELSYHAIIGFCVLFPELTQNHVIKDCVADKRNFDMLLKQKIYNEICFDDMTLRDDKIIEDVCTLTHPLLF